MVEFTLLWQMVIIQSRCNPIQTGNGGGTKAYLEFHNLETFFQHPEHPFMDISNFQSPLHRLIWVLSKMEYILFIQNGKSMMANGPSSFF